MSEEPFAYGIQAPIGSVVPLFHKRKDAEDYIVKLTDSRDEAKIIPLYRAKAERPLGDPEIAVEILKLRVAELEEAIRRLADQDATLSVQGGNVTVTMDATLTDAERKAVEWFAEVPKPLSRLTKSNRREQYIAALRGLLDRLGDK